MRENTSLFTRRGVPNNFYLCLESLAPPFIDIYPMTLTLSLKSSVKSLSKEFPLVYF